MKPAITGFLALFLSGTATLAGAEPGDPIVVAVSLNDQSLRVFRGQEQIANSNVSSGKAGHDTPTGIFSILQKNRHHRSNIYSNAPMPFMQRLTWSGIALHASNSVPRYPASHGCVRLPHKFAGQLFKMATMGMHVIIEDETEMPRKVQHEALFTPKVTWSVSKEYDRWVNAHIAEANIGFATSDQRYPARIFITRRTAKDDLFDVQRLLNKLGFDAGDVDGIMGPATWDAVSRYRKAKNLEGTGSVDAVLVKSLFAEAGELRPPNGRLLVRKHHSTIYEAYIHIKDEEEPLGSHLLTVTGFDRKAQQTGWMAITLNDRVQAQFNLDEGVTLDGSSGRHSLTSTLSRIQMSGHDREQINRFLSPKSSITVSDNGMSIETGERGTDFIVLSDPKNGLSQIASETSEQPG